MSESAVEQFTGETPMGDIISHMYNSLSFLVTC